MKAEVPIIRRLGPVPFWRGEEKCLVQLENAYRRAMEAARGLLLKQGAAAANGTAKGPPGDAVGPAARRPEISPK